MPKSGPHRRKPKGPLKLGAKNTIKAWRIYRGLTVAQLAEMTDQSTGNISAIENRRQGFSDESLEKLANALKTTPGALLDIDPLADGEESFWPLWEKAGPADRETIRMMASRLIETGKSRK